MLSLPQIHLGHTFDLGHGQPLDSIVRFGRALDAPDKSPNLRGEGCVCCAGAGMGLVSYLQPNSRLYKKDLGHLGHGLEIAEISGFSSRALSGAHLGHIGHQPLQALPLVARARTLKREERLSARGQSAQIPAQPILQASSRPPVLGDDSRRSTIPSTSPNHFGS
jgi:hypothetical protein